MHGGGASTVGAFRQSETAVGGALRGPPGRKRSLAVVFVVDVGVVGYLVGTGVGLSPDLRERRE
jgi:hypothetical protein